MIKVDILEQLQIDPGKLTLGELLQERERAAHEIHRLRLELQHRRDSLVKRDLEPVKDRQTVEGSRELIRINDLSNLLGVSRSTIYRWLSLGQFPHPVRISERSVRWRVDDIEAWKAGLEL